MNAGTPPQIDRFRFGRVVIDGRVFQRDLIVFPDGAIDNWSRDDSHFLSAEDIDIVLEMKPKTIIIGTGVFKSMKVPAEALVNIRAAGIEVLIRSSPRACDEYNQRRLVERTVLAIHLTC
jgi:hypothetical protein